MCRVGIPIGHRSGIPSLLYAKVFQVVREKLFHKNLDSQLSGLLNGFCLEINKFSGSPIVL